MEIIFHLLAILGAAVLIKIWSRDIKKILNPNKFLYRLMDSKPFNCLVCLAGDCGFVLSWAFRWGNGFGDWILYMLMAAGTVYLIGKR